MAYIEKIRLSIKSGNIGPVLKHAIIKRWPIWCIKDKYTLDLQMQDREYRKLNKKYRDFVVNTVQKDCDLIQGEYRKVIWWCWLQGFEQAPELVKSCYYSLKKNMPEYEIVILTNENISQYIDLPRHIMDKYNNKVIGAAHYSDIVRLFVLLKYGGIWIDSTVMCTDSNMCDLLEQSNLFVYQDLTTSNIAASNWLISARSNNKILSLTLKLLLEFWKNNSVVNHYYVFHLFFKMATLAYPDEWKEVSVFDNVSPHILVDELSNEYSEKRVEQIKRISSYHKLNYKREYDKNNNTMYKKLIVSRNF